MIALTLALGLALSIGSSQEANSYNQQAVDADARAAAKRAALYPFEQLTSHLVKEAANSPRWRLVTNDLIRKNSAYPAPAAYEFARSVVVDLDRDGKADVAEFVVDGPRGAIRVRLGSGATRIIAVGKPRIYGQGLFAVGKHAFMVNYPESSVVLTFMRNGKFFAVYEGE